MRRILLPCFALFFFTSALSIAQSATSSTSTFSVSPQTHDAVQRLIGDAVLNGKAYEYDGHLADMIGPRLTGSSNYMRAAEWANRQFKALGLANVHTEEWTIPAAWEPDKPAIGRIVSPVDHILHIYSAGWSPSTPTGGVAGEIVYVPSLLPAALDAQKAQIAGKIVLLDRASNGANSTLAKTLAGRERLFSASPLAVILTGRPNGGQVLGAVNVSGEIAPVPVVQIGLEDSLLIKRLLERGPVSAQFSFTNTIRTGVKVPTVIAEIPGSERPSEVVILGAHLDSWHPGTGAQDNGTGVASVLEAARAIQALHRPPRRTIRFMLFGGEEQGLLGSTAYVRQHLADLSQIDAVLASDSGSEPAKGWYVMGRNDEIGAVGALKPLLSGLGADGVTTDTDLMFQTDHISFEMLGVPALVLWNGMDKYESLTHQAADTFDSVVQKDLTQGATVVTVTVYAIADGEGPFASHFSPAEIQSMLKTAGTLDDFNYLKSMGVLP